jgi:hypothetical protein
MHKQAASILTITALALALLAGLSYAAHHEAGDKALDALIVGGGSAHDFDRWFNKQDTATLEAAGIDAAYTDQPRKIGDALSELDVVCLTNNKPIPGDAVRGAIFDFVEDGGGLVIVHAATCEATPRSERFPSR